MTYQQIKDKYSPVDSAFRRDVQLLLKALELAASELENLLHEYVSPHQYSDADYWLCKAQKELNNGTNKKIS